MTSLDESQANQLHHEVAQLHLEINHLSGVISDLEGAVRYLTNNLLDERYHPQIACQARALMADEQTTNTSREVEAGEAVTAADDLPFPEGHAVRAKIERLVRFLQEQAVALKGVQALGSVTEMQWWENCGEGIVNANASMDELRARGAKMDVDIQPIIEHAGGIPTAMLRSEVPDGADDSHLAAEDRVLPGNEPVSDPSDDLRTEKERLADEVIAIVEQLQALGEQHEHEASMGRDAANKWWQKFGVEVSRANRRLDSKQQQAEAAGVKVHELIESAGSYPPEMHIPVEFDLVALAEEKTPVSKASDGQARFGF